MSRDWMNRGLCWGAVLMGLGITSTLCGQESRSLTFRNPIADGADPWVIRRGTEYYWCQAYQHSVLVSRSRNLHEQGESIVAWTAPATGPHAREIWAPELHFLDGRWYIYVAASNGENKNHRTIVLESMADDPLTPFHFKSELATGDGAERNAPNRWAIDATVLEVRGQRYLVWSGWEDHQDIQYLYIAAMKSPWELQRERVRLCHNADYRWERVSESDGERGLHEAPQILQREGRVFLIYSCSGSWEPTYKLGMLTLKEGGDPLCPSDWSKHPEPIFLSTSETFGVGHCCFARSPSGSEDWLLYHAKRSREPGWDRYVMAQRFQWKPDGSPDFGQPVRVGQTQDVPQ